MASPAVSVCLSARMGTALTSSSEQKGFDQPGHVLAGSVARQLVGVKWHNEGDGAAEDRTLQGTGPHPGRTERKESVPAACTREGLCSCFLHFYFFLFAFLSARTVLHQAPACPNWKPSPTAELPPLFNQSLPRSSLQDSSRARRALPICRITFPVLSLQASFKNPPSCYLYIHVFPGKTFNVE